MQEIVIIVVLAIANGIFAGTEIATISARRGRLQQAAEDGNAGAAAALKLQDDPNRFLSAVQVGITLIGTLNGVFAGATLSDRLASWLNTFPTIQPYAASLAQLVVVVLVTYLSLVLGELVPKRLAMQNAERVAMLMSRPMSFIAKLSTPMIALLTGSTNLLLRLFGRGNTTEERVTEEDIRQLVREGAEGGAVEPHEQEIIEQLFEASERTVRNIMTPRRDVYLVDGDDRLADVIDNLLDSGFSRFPVFEGQSDRIIGIAHVRDLLRLYRSRGDSAIVREAISPPIYVPENSPAMALMTTFRKTQRHMAIVIDELGSVAGVVSLEDLLEEIVGEIADEYDDAETPAVVKREDGSYLVDGVTEIDEIKELLDIDELPDEDSYRFDTLAGFVISLLGHIPTTGDIAKWGGWKFEVVDMDGLRIDKVLIRHEVPESSNPTETPSAPPK